MALMMPMMGMWGGGWSHMAETGMWGTGSGAWVWVVMSLRDDRRVRCSRFGRTPPCLRSG
jgi:hypothetical protein